MILLTLNLLKLLKIHEYPQGLVTSACQKGGTGGLIARSDIWALLELIREYASLTKYTSKKYASLTKLHVKNISRSCNVQPSWSH